MYSKVSSDDQGCISIWLLYRGDITTSDAMAMVYKLANTDNIKNVGLCIHNLIKRAFKDSTDLLWPPTAHDLPSPDGLLPDKLVRFLNFAITGSGEVKQEYEKTKRLVLSIGQDICRAATEGQWKLPKHILICATIRHLYRGKQLATILNRLGHCESYHFGLELETALVSSNEIDEQYIHKHNVHIQVVIMMSYLAFLYACHLISISGRGS